MLDGNMGLKKAEPCPRKPFLDSPAGKRLGGEVSALGPRGTL